MPKQIDWEAIRKHWQQTGASSQAIADKFGVSKRAVDERLPKWRDTEKLPQKVVPIQSAKAASHPPTRPRRHVNGEELEELEVINLAIADLAAALGSGETDSRSLGGIAGGLVRLLEYRRKIQPRTAAELAEVAIAMGVSPDQFMAALREQWRLRA